MGSEKIIEKDLVFEINKCVFEGNQYTGWPIGKFCLPKGNRKTICVLSRYKNLSCLFVGFVANS